MHLLLSMLILAIVSWGVIADAQAISLPKLDNINFFGQVGEFDEIDTRWDPSSCTKPPTIAQNVVLGRFSQASDPDRMEVCSFAMIYSGWKSIGTRCAPGRCGAGADSITRNFTVIERQ